MENYVTARWLNMFRLKIYQLLGNGKLGHLICLRGFRIISWMNIFRRNHIALSRFGLDWEDGYPWTRHSLCARTCLVRKFCSHFFVSYPKLIYLRFKPWSHNLKYVKLLFSSRLFGPLKTKELRILFGSIFLNSTSDSTFNKLVLVYINSTKKRLAIQWRRCFHI